MKRLAALGLLLAACQPDETLSGYTDPDAIWQLEELNGARFDARATLQFPEPGKASGQAPCNRYSAELTKPLPWFGLSPIAATKMACPDMAAETRYFAALSAMTLAEVLADVLILSDEDGRQMVFRAKAPAP